LPLSKAAKIVHGNALRIDWEGVVEKEKLNFILGNPPFVGKQLQNTQQKEDMQQVFTGVNGAGVLDYVTAWYIKAAKLIQNTKIRCAFVSTSSISQGEQVGILWQELYKQYKIKIHFAHRTVNIHPRDTEYTERLLLIIKPLCSLCLCGSTNWYFCSNNLLGFLSLGNLHQESQGFINRVTCWKCLGYIRIQQY
jgi:hypothetical protein